MCERTDDGDDFNNDCDVDEDDYDYADDHHLLHDNSGGTRITGCRLPIATECAGARRKVATLIIMSFVMMTLSPPSSSPRSSSSHLKSSYC